MNVDKQKLKEMYQKGDLNYVFRQAHIISDFLLTRYFKIYDYDDRMDLVQECLENFYKKIVQNKVDANNNIFSFIWANSSFTVRERLRKQRKRESIVKFYSLDEALNYKRMEEESEEQNI